VDRSKSYALLKDWKERFNGTLGSRSPRFSTPNRNEGDTAPTKHVRHKDPEASDQLKQPAEVGDTDEDDEVQTLIAGSGLDPEVLRAALQRGLAESGADVEGLDESTLLQFAARMLGGQESSDDIAGELAAQLLGGEEDAEEEPEEEPEEEQSHPTGLSQWVSRQAAISRRNFDPLSPADSETKSPSVDTTSPPTKLPI